MDCDTTHLTTSNKIFFFVSTFYLLQAIQERNKLKMVFQFEVLSD